MTGINFFLAKAVLQKLFPDKDPKDIENACKQYFSYDDFTGVYIEEVDFYN